MSGVQISPPRPEFAAAGAETAAVCLTRARSSNWIEHQPSKLGVVGSPPAGRASFPKHPCKRKEAPDDRSLYLAHAQRAQDPHHARGNRPRVRGPAGEHPYRRAVQTRVPANQPEQQDPRDRRPQRAGRKSARGFRVRSDSRLSGGENGEAAAPRCSWKVRRAGVADVPDGVGRPDDGAGRTFPQQRRARTHRVRDQPLHERGPALARSDGETAIGGVVLCRLRYSIADIAIFPWLRASERNGIDWAEFPKVKKWFDGIAARPAVQRALNVLADAQTTPPGQYDPKAREILFGATQYQRH